VRSVVREAPARPVGTRGAVRPGIGGRRHTAAASANREMALSSLGSDSSDSERSAAATRVPLIMRVTACPTTAAGNVTS
jgi:hypothetical protein